MQILATGEAQQNEYIHTGTATLFKCGDSITLEVEAKSGTDTRTHLYSVHSLNTDQSIQGLAFIVKKDPLWLVNYSVGSFLEGELGAKQIHVKKTEEHGSRHGIIQRYG